MTRSCDIVMEGGGVKGLALVGALTGLDQAGYTFRRVAGTSAGAIVGAVVAAGMPITELKKLLASFDYRKFRDEGLLDQFGLLGKTLSLLLEKGVYEGDYLR